MEHRLTFVFLFSVTGRIEAAKFCVLRKGRSGRSDMRGGQCLDLAVIVGGSNFNDSHVDQIDPSKTTNDRCACAVDKTRRQCVQPLQSRYPCHADLHRAPETIHFHNVIDLKSGRLLEQIQNFVTRTKACLMGICNRM